MNIYWAYCFFLLLDPSTTLRMTGEQDETGEYRPSTDIHGHCSSRRTFSASVMAMVVPWRGVKMSVLLELHLKVKFVRSSLVQ